MIGLGIEKLRTEIFTEPYGARRNSRYRCLRSTAILKKLAGAETAATQIICRLKF